MTDWHCSFQEGLWKNKQVDKLVYGDSNHLFCARHLCFPSAGEKDIIVIITIILIILIIISSS